MKQLKSLLKEDISMSRPVYVDDCKSQTEVYNIYKFKLGDTVVYFATTESKLHKKGEIAHAGRLPWFWATYGEAVKHIEKWR